MNRKTPLVILAVVVGMTMMFATQAFAYANSVTYTGQGLIADGFGGYDLQTEICGVQNGADADGPYLLWVLTATGAKNADITEPWGTVPMVKTGDGTFKYVSGWYEPSALPGNVTATYDGKPKNAQLVISHGCRPYSHGARCSPGFWSNATDARHDPYGQRVHVGQQASGPFNLTPFNATGAFLTDNMPGFDFDPSFMTSDDSQTCPIDHFGNFKVPSKEPVGKRREAHEGNRGPLVWDAIAPDARLGGPGSFKIVGTAPMHS
jgi:hypothetical protein